MVPEPPSPGGFFLIGGNTTPGAGSADRCHPSFCERERGDLDRHRPQVRSGQKALAALGPLAGGRCFCDDPRPTSGKPVVRRASAER